jgi:hypothetical protein
MVRLSMKFALAALLVIGLAIVALEVDGQTAPQSPAQTAPQRLTPTPQAKTPQATPHKSRSHARAKKTEVAETPPAPPPPPPTLEQTPPTAPNVSLTNGELTIDASNSTLSQVLHAVHNLTGASVDMPGTTANDRVVAHLGPGEPRDVLNTLLNGSKFNYVILGVEGDPGGVQKIILTTRQAGGVTAAQNQPAPQPAEESEEPVAENPYPRPGPPGFHRPGFPTRPGQPISNNNENNENNENNNGDEPQNSFAGPGGEAQQNGGKTPEQLMQELQQMQQQQQQYEQQLNPANRTPQQ